MSDRASRTRYASIKGMDLLARAEDVPEPERTALCLAIERLIGQAEEAVRVRKGKERERGVL